MACSVCVCVCVCVRARLHFSIFLHRVHFGQITTNQVMLSVMDELRVNTISKVREIRVSVPPITGLHV